jgi:hypothetical protein
MDIVQNPMTAALIKKCKVRVRSLGELVGTVSVLPPGPDHFIEIFSPPRLVPLVGHYTGMQACLSVDILGGWDLSNPQIRNFVKNVVRARGVRAVMLSPPCTTYSCIQNLNTKGDPDLKEAILRS